MHTSSNIFVLLIFAAWHIFSLHFNMVPSRRNRWKEIPLGQFHKVKAFVLPRRESIKYFRVCCFIFVCLFISRSQFDTIERTELDCNYFIIECEEERYRGWDKDGKTEIEKEIQTVCNSAKRNNAAMLKQFELERMRICNRGVGIKFIIIIVLCSRSVCFAK